MSATNQQPASLYPCWDLNLIGGGLIDVTRMNWIIIFFLIHHLLSWYGFDIHKYYLYYHLLNKSHYSSESRFMQFMQLFISVSIFGNGISIFGTNGISIIRNASINRNVSKNEPQIPQCARLMGRETQWGRPREEDMGRETKEGRPREGDQERETRWGRQNGHIAVYVSWAAISKSQASRVYRLSPQEAFPTRGVPIIGVGEVTAGKPLGRKVRAGQTWVGEVTAGETLVGDVTAGQTRGGKGQLGSLGNDKGQLG